MSLEYESSHGVAVLTFDRPDVLNAFDEELGTATLEAVERATRDPSVRCMVVTGSGRAFSSGEDLAALAGAYEAGRRPDLGRRLTTGYNPLIEAITTAPKPVVAALNGVAAGAGVSIALACDFRIASERAKLVFPWVRIGLVPDLGLMWLLTRSVGASRAWDLAARGRTLSAQDAADMSLVTEVAPGEAFESAWRSFAQELAAGPTRAYAIMKEVLASALETSLPDQLRREAELQKEAGRTEDHLEGVRAFMAKRTPQFRGR